MFAFLSAVEIDICKYRGIYTLEALADLTAEQAEELQLSKEHRLVKTFMALNKDAKKIIDFENIEKKIPKPDLTAGRKD